MVIFIGLVAEGPSDHRFLEPIIEKTVTEIAFESQGQIDIELKIIECDKGDSFIEYVSNGSKIGFVEYGINILIVHADADGKNSEETYKNKIQPMISHIESLSEEEYCKNIIALVPVHETEAWMLADKNILISQIGTSRSENELNINGNPESFTNPKERIKEAIKIGRSDMPKKMRSSLQITDLYSYMGQSIQIEKLRALESFQDFELNIRTILTKINLLF